MKSCKIKLFYPEQFFSSRTEDRHEIFEILKSKLRLESYYRETDNQIQKRIEWVKDERKANYIVLPMSWNFYFKKNLQNQVLAYFNLLNKKGIKVLSFTSGDFGISPKVSELTLVYRYSGYASSWKSNYCLLPYVVSDPIERFFDNDKGGVLKELSSLKPIIGFTGMSPKSHFIFLKEIFQVIFRNILCFLGLSYFDKQQVQSTSFKRNVILNLLEGDKQLQVNFIRRKKYRAGAKTTAERRSVAEAYYKNQLDSQAIVCLRGLGNFSARFYETLAMGRIPIFINTNGVLPNIDELSWEDYIIKVDYSNRKQLVKVILEWFRNHKNHDQFYHNRKMWQEKLSLEGFWNSEIDRLLQG